jgi:hypothetical protein
LKKSIKKGAIREELPLSAPGLFFDFSPERVYPSGI